MAVAHKLHSYLDFAGIIPMKRIVALVVTAAVISTLTAIGPVAAQTQCRSSETRAEAQACIRDCGRKFPPSKNRQEYQTCQEGCIAACK
jgi:hypothetical protein